MGGRAFGGSTPACSVPAHLAGQPVSVMLGDAWMSPGTGSPAMGHGMMASRWGAAGNGMLRAVPATVTPGTVTFVVRNVGSKTHEMVILPLSGAAGQRVVGTDGTVDESGSLGEASNPCATGSGDGITAGSVSWVTVTLTPGRYELICNLPNHYAAGMYQEFDVV